MGATAALYVRARGGVCQTANTPRGPAERAQTRPKGSYVAALVDEGPAAAARKVGEEGLELALAGAGESDERVVSEAADLLFHLYVLLAARGLDPAAVDAELADRRR